jgi:hypothetical protein
MFIRQFSLRLLLTIITACAGFSLILSFAWRGRYWAISLAVLLLTLLATVLVQGVTFWLVWLFSLAADRWRQRSPPSAADRDG